MLIVCFPGSNCRFRPLTFFDSPPAFIIRLMTYEAKLIAGSRSFNRIPAARQSPGNLVVSSVNFGFETVSKTFWRRGAFPRISSAALLQEKVNIFSSFVGVRKQEGDLDEQSVLTSLRMVLHMWSSKLSLSFGDELIAASMDLWSLPVLALFQAY